MQAKKDNLNEILPQIPQLYLASTQATFGSQCLASSVQALDHFLEGGLRVGELSEWGAPLGRGGRHIIIRYLARQRNLSVEKSGDDAFAPSSLWVSAKSDVTVYPPAWMARGVDLSRVRFTQCTHPVRDLKPVFFDSFFKFVVLDAPQHLSTEDCAFLAQRARANKQTILIIRNHFLTEKQGNVWAKLRLNCWQDDDGERFFLKVVRGLSPRELVLQASSLE